MFDPHRQLGLFLTNRPVYSQLADCKRVIYICCAEKSLLHIPNVFGESETCSFGPADQFVMIVV